MPCPGAGPAAQLKKVRLMNPGTDTPLLLAYEGVLPRLLGPVRSAVGAAVLGRVTLGADAVLGVMAVLRADGHVIEVGAGLHLGRHSTVHIAHGVYGSFIGAHVSVGANAVVHACTVGEDCVVQDDVAILDGASVGAGSALAAGSVVYPRTRLPPGHWCAGAPAVAVRPLASGELQALHDAVRTAPAGAAPAPLHTGTRQPGASPGAYVAATVTGSGPVQLAAGSSLWFGCELQTAGQGLALGEHSNVQDNSVLHAATQPIHIGAGCTIGHNVFMEGCSVGDRVLVGMSSRIAAGTVIESDVLVAAGSTTLPGQVLQGGWLWGGRPARRLLVLDEAKRSVIERSARVYGDYAREFAQRQAEASARSLLPRTLT